MKLERLLLIIFKLLNKEVLSASSLANEFQVSTRTIYRDIDTICAAGIPVVSFSGSKGGFGIMEGYKFNKSLIGSYDILNLVTVLSSLSSVFEDQKVENTINRLKSLDTNIKNANESLIIDLEGHRTEPKALSKIRKAIDEKRVISLNYVSNKKELTTRKIEPIQLYYKYRNWYLYSYCKVQLDYREFRVSRMLNINLTEENFLNKHKIKEHLYQNNPLKDDYEEVELIVDSVSLSQVLDKFQSASKIFNEDGISFILSVYKPLEANWLISILLSFGNGVKIVKPIALQTMVIDEARKIIKVYEDV